VTPAPGRPDHWRASAELGICPICQNLFRTDGHSFDCPLAAPAPDAGLRAAATEVLECWNGEGGADLDDAMDALEAALSWQAEKETA
jgi:hypothetical protein